MIMTKITVTPPNTDNSLLPQYPYPHR